MGMNVCDANPRNPVLATFDRPLGEWHVVASHLEAKGPPEIVDKIHWRLNGFQCLGAEDAAALGKWMNQALIDDAPSPILRPWPPEARPAKRDHVQRDRSDRKPAASQL
jgi:hypothetical protein